MTMNVCVMLALTAAVTAAVTAAGSPAIQDLSWMAGAWGAEVEGTAMEEHWTAPRAGLMVGMHRDVLPSGKAFFEFLRIETRADGIVYVAMPRGATPTDFPLKESTARRVVFENLKHDFPQRILYWLDAEGRLHARVEGPSGGKERNEEWAWEPLR
jgi:hypothetical protein